MNVQKIDIEQIQLSGTNPRKFFKNESIEELAGSIKKNGLIQPITVRPITPDQRSAKNNEMINFELVAGERRLRASTKANLESIDAIVREMDDEEAFDIQVVENLQREEIHPLDEADGFRRMLASDRYTIDEIAARMGKSKTFVTRRLKLNDLVDDFRRKFYEDEILLGHALLICRLEEADQDTLYQELWVDGAWRGEPTVKELKNHIETRVLREISEATFEPDDVTIYPEAGSCSNCPKRSGANLSLFPDIEDGDRCFDSACFAQKTRLALERRVEEVTSSDNDVYLVRSSHSDANMEMINELEESGHSVLVEWDDFVKRTNKDLEGTKKGLFLNGYSTGEIVNIVLEKTAATREKVDEETSVEMEIKGIEEREARKVELDREKVQKAIIDHMKDLGQLAESILSREELLNFAVTALYIDAIDNDLEELILKTAKGKYAIQPDEEENLDWSGKRRLITKYLLEFGHTYAADIIRSHYQYRMTSSSDLDPDKWSKAYAYRFLAESLAPTAVGELKDEQDEKANKRKARVAERLGKLNQEKE